MTLATTCLAANLQIGAAGGSSKEIIAAGAAVRNHFYVNTLLWKGNGDRLLPCKNFVAFMGGHLALKKEFAGLLTGVGAEAADKFYVRLDIDLIAEELPQLKGLPQAVHHQVIARLEKAMAVREARAAEDLWSRLVDPLTHFTNKMESGESFRDATIRNLAEAVELLPRLNFSDDLDLQHKAEEMRAMIVGLNPKSLRKNEAARAGVAKMARLMLTDIERIRAC